MPKELHFQCRLQLTSSADLMFEASAVNGVKQDQNVPYGTVWAMHKLHSSKRLLTV